MGQTALIGARLSRAWRLINTTPVIATTSSVARVLAVFSLVAAILCAVGSQHDSVPDRSGEVLALIAIITMAVSGLIFATAERIPRSLMHVLVMLGTTAVAGVTAVYVSPSMTLITAVFLINLSLVGAFFSWVAALAHVTYAAVVLTTAVLMPHPQLLTEVLMLDAMLFTSVILVGILIRLAGNSLIDGLTGTYNRQGFESMTDGLASRSSSGHLAVLDIDNMHSINQSCGYASGDTFLRASCASWRSSLPERFVLARIGGDDFAIFMSETTREQALAWCDVMQAATPGAVFSCGVTPWVTSEHVNSGLRRATAALDDAKRTGRARTVFREAPRLDLLGDLKQALDAGDITVRFQPLVSLAAPEHIVGLEALARWTAADGVQHSPSDFIALAENQGLITQLGQSILCQACEQMERIRRDTNQDLWLFVNTSGLELNEPGFASRALNTTRDCQLPPERLVLEITETTLDSQYPASIATLTELRRAGVKVAIDDFGTGYSSLSRLGRLPVDFLKLDRAFVDEIDERSAAPLLHVIASIGASMSLPIIAEGIERPYQAKHLADLGYSFGQGWMYHRDMSTDEVIEVLSRPAHVNLATSRRVIRLDDESTPERPQQ